MSDYSKERMAKLNKYVHKEIPSHETMYDSDDDMYHHNFKTQERIDFLDQNDQWHTGYVDIALDEMVKCVS